MTGTKPFWEQKSLGEMTEAEWESLCDGCGKCCMAKLIDEDTDELVYTTVACRLYDGDNCRCSDYENRQKHVSDCVRLTPDNVATIAWLPQTCAYRLIHEGRPLYEWHPLVTGDPQSAVKAGMSVFGRITAWEHELAHDGEYLDHLIDEPL